MKVFIAVAILVFGGLYAADYFDNVFYAPEGLFCTLDYDDMSMALKLLREDNIDGLKSMVAAGKLFTAQKNEPFLGLMILPYSENYIWAQSLTDGKCLMIDFDALSPVHLPSYISRIDINNIFQKFFDTLEDFFNSII